MLLFFVLFGLHLILLSSPEPYGEHLRSSRQASESVTTASSTSRTREGLMVGLVTTVVYWSFIDTPKNNFYTALSIMLVLLVVSDLYKPIVAAKRVGFSVSNVAWNSVWVAGAAAVSRYAHHQGSKVLELVGLKMYTKNGQGRRQHSEEEHFRTKVLEDIRRDPEAQSYRRR